MQISAFLAYALGRPSECLDLISGVSFAKGLKASHPTLVVTSADQKIEATSSSAPVTATEIGDGDAWVLMEAIRTACLEGV